MTAALAELVDAAVRERADEFRELVRVEVDRALERLVGELVAGELEQRHNGASPHAHAELEAPGQ